MRKKILPAILLLLGVMLTTNAQSETVNGTLTVKSTSDAITTLQTLDDKWLYSQWVNSQGVRKSFMGFNNNLTQFNFSLENGANTFSFNGAQKFTILDGNFGIGTQNPIAKFTINDGTQMLNILPNKKLTGTWPAITESRTITFQSTGSSAGNIAFATGNNERMRISSNGRVGIGTDNPLTKLDVNGNMQIRSSEDGILTLQTMDDSWLYTNWKDQHGARKAWVGFNSNLTNFGINLENGANMFTIMGGDVGIGTTDTKGYKLGVNGKIIATELKIELYSNWSDFVFEKDYYLPSLTEVENHIKEKGHLKDIPSAEEVSQNGFYLGEMDAKLLQKIEELTLYTIEQEKKIKNQASEIEKLKSLEERLLKLEELLNNK